MNEQDWKRFIEFENNLTEALYLHNDHTRPLSILLHMALWHGRYDEENDDFVGIKSTGELLNDISCKLTNIIDLLENK